MSERATAWGAYKTITDALRRRIVGGEYPAGSLLPSEAALTAEYGVARNTLRRALSDLEREGLLSALPGRGRVVCGPDAADTAAEGPVAAAGAGAGERNSSEDVSALLYKRIAAELRDRIVRSELKPGDAVPSEAALTSQYGVSRGTARQALIELQGAGLIETVHGKGRFVRRPDDRDV